MTVRNSLVLVLVGATLNASPLSGQSDRTLPAVGTHAVTFSLPEGGGAGFGLRKMRSPAANVGVEFRLGAHHQSVDLDGQTTQENSTLSLGVHPDVRVYRRTSGPVVPFLEWSGGVDYREASAGGWIVDGMVGVGLGVEWFPLSGMSISGSTGLAATYSHRNDIETVVKAVGVGAFRSRLLLNLYF